MILMVSWRSYHHPNGGVAWLNSGPSPIEHRSNGKHPLLHPVLELSRLKVSLESGEICPHIPSKAPACSMWGLLSTGGWDSNYNVDGAEQASLPVPFTLWVAKMCLMALAQSQHWWGHNARAWAVVDQAAHCHKILKGRGNIISLFMRTCFGQSFGQSRSGRFRAQFTRWVSCTSTIKCIRVMQEDTL